MATFQGVLFLVLGVGLLFVVYQSLSRGFLPCGPKGLSGRLEFRKDEQPLAFWLLFLLYAAAGLALTIFAVRVLTGSAASLPLR
jgi:hypothetical protein